MTLADSIALLEREELDLVFPSFGPAEAWDLGHVMLDLALDRSYKVAIDIHKPGLTVFRYSMAGTTADQESWIERKRAVVMRMETSSKLFAARMELSGYDPMAVGWLDSSYALAGGSFPVRVAGVGVVAAVTVSGDAGGDDHAYVVDGIRAYLASRPTGLSR